MRENYLQRKVINWLNDTYKEDIVVYNIHGNAFQKKGIPDLLLCYKGRFIAIELKQDSGTVSKIQEYRLDLIRKADGIAVVCRSLEEVKELFRRIN